MYGRVGEREKEDEQGEQGEAHFEHECFDEALRGLAAEPYQRTLAGGGIRQFMALVGGVVRERSRDHSASIYLRAVWPFPTDYLDRFLRSIWDIPYVMLWSFPYFLRAHIR